MMITTKISSAYNVSSSWWNRWRLSSSEASLATDVANANANDDGESDEKSVYLHLLSEEDPIRMDHVRSCCLSKRGLVKHSTRALLWPKLLGIGRVEQGNSEDSSGVAGGDHRDHSVRIVRHAHYEQVQKDVERSMFKFTDHMTELERQYKRKQLSRLIHTLLSKPASEILGNLENSGMNDSALHSMDHSWDVDESECSEDEIVSDSDDESSIGGDHIGGNGAQQTNTGDVADGCIESGGVHTLNNNSNNGSSSSLDSSLSEREHGLSYFQGFHDISTVFLLVCGEHISGPCLEKMARYYLRDSIATDRLAPMLMVLRLIHFVILQKDYGLAKFMADAGVEDGHYALSWVLTWFSHVIDSLDIVARLFDAFLASHPLLPMYLSASIVLRQRDNILQLPTEFSAVFGYLNRIHERHEYKMDEIDALLEDALALMDRYHPDRLQIVSRVDLGRDSSFNQYPFDYLRLRIRPDKIKFRKRRRRGTRMVLMEQYGKKFHYVPPRQDSSITVLHILEGIGIGAAMIAVGIGYYYAKSMT